MSLAPVAPFAEAAPKDFREQAGVTTTARDIIIPGLLRLFSQSRIPCCELLRAREPNAGDCANHEEAIECRVKEST